MSLYDEPMHLSPAPREIDADTIERRARQLAAEAFDNGDAGVIDWLSGACGDYVDASELARITVLAAKRWDLDSRFYLDKAVDVLREQYIEYATVHDHFLDAATELVAEEREEA